MGAPGGTTALDMGLEHDKEEPQDNHQQLHPGRVTQGQGHTGTGSHSGANCMGLGPAGGPGSGGRLCAHLHGVVVPHDPEEIDLGVQVLIAQAVLEDPQIACRGRLVRHRSQCACGHMWHLGSRWHPAPEQPTKYH